MTPKDPNRIIEKIRQLKEINETLWNFFRNQQRFIHLYLLANGCEVTSKIIHELMESMGRSFSPQTFYNTRSELKDKGWLGKDVEFKSGQPEVPHRVEPTTQNRLNEFKEEIIGWCIIDRPVTLSKYHIFDIGLNYSKLPEDAPPAQWLTDLNESLAGLQDKKLNLPAPDTFLFYPHFLLENILENVAEAFTTGSHICTAISPDRKLIATGHSDGTLKIIDTRTGLRIATIKANNGAILSVAFSPNGKLIASGGEDSVITISDVSFGKSIERLTGFKTGNYALAFSPSSQEIACASRDGNVRYWKREIPYFSTQFLGDGEVISLLSFSQDGNEIYAMQSNGRFTNWGTKSIADNATGGKCALFKIERRQAALRRAPSRSRERQIEVELKDGNKGTISAFEYVIDNSPKLRMRTKSSSLDGCTMRLEIEQIGKRKEIYRFVKKTRLRSDQNFEIDLEKIADFDPSRSRTYRFDVYPMSN